MSLDLTAVGELVEPVGNNLFAGLHSAVDDDGTPGSQSNRDSADLDRISWIDHVNVIPVGAALDSSTGNNGDIVLSVNEQMYVHELIREERVVLIAEDCLELVRACRRVNLIVHRLQKATGDLGCVVAIICIHGQAIVSAQRLINLRQF